MRSLARAARNRGASGEALPQPIEAIKNLGFVQRRGQLSLLVAGPGAGKSALALCYMLKAQVPTLYISADTDASDQASRAMAYFSGKTIGEVREDADEYVGLLSQIPRHCAFEFDSEPEADEILEMCKAYRLVWGFYPHLVIVDTIGKIWSDVGDEVARNKEAVKQCQDLARITGAHVLALHHATKMHDSGDKPIPLDGIMSGVSKIPEQVLSMWRTGENTICLSPIKNRSGPSDATAMSLRAFVNLNIERMIVGSIRPAQFSYDNDVELQ